MKKARKINFVITEDQFKNIKGDINIELIVTHANVKILASSGLGKLKINRV